jgi:hypothetical protein
MTAEVEVKCVLTGGSLVAGTVSQWQMEEVDSDEDLLMIDDNNKVTLRLMDTLLHVGGKAMFNDGERTYEGAWLLDEDGYTVRWFQHGALMSATWEWSRG